MSDKAKDHFNDRSTRLETLLSDFLNKEIDVMPAAPATPEAKAGKPEFRASENETGIDDDPAFLPPLAGHRESAKVVPVNRTDTWESSITSNVNPTLQVGVNHAGPFENPARQGYSRIDPVDELEKSINSVLASSPPDSNRKMFFTVAAVFFVFITMGLFYWAGSRRPVNDLNESAISSSPGEFGNAEASAEATGYDSHLTEPKIGTSEGSAPGASNDGNPPAQAQEVSVQTSPNSSQHEQKLLSSATPHDSSGPQSGEATKTEEKTVGVSASSMVALPPNPANMASNLPLPDGPNLQVVKATQPATPLPLPPAPGTSATASFATALNHAASSPQMGIVTHEMALVRVQPVYPDIARRMNLSGMVEVTITVDRTGKVVDAKAISGPMVLQGPTERALKQWRFRPVMIDGKPAAGQGKISVVFHKPQP